MAVSERGTITPCEDFKTWGGGYSVYDQASELVTTQFDNTEQYATTYSLKVQSLMDDLVDYLTTGQPANPTLEYDEVDPPNINISVYAPPPAPNIGTVVVPDKPVMVGEIQPIVIGNPLAPIDDTKKDEAPDFIYEESPYLSQGGLLPFLG